MHIPWPESPGHPRSCAGCLTSIFVGLCCFFWLFRIERIVAELFAEKREQKNSLEEKCRHGSRVGLPKSPENAGVRCNSTLASVCISLHGFLCIRMFTSFGHWDNTLQSDEPFFGCSQQVCKTSVINNVLLNSFRIPEEVPRSPGPNKFQGPKKSIKIERCLLGLFSNWFLIGSRRLGSWFFAATPREDNTTHVSIRLRSLPRRRQMPAHSFHLSRLPSDVYRRRQMEA